VKAGCKAKALDLTDFLVVVLFPVDGNQFLVHANVPMESYQNL
jgi:hypothetical protein